MTMLQDAILTVSNDLSSSTMDSRNVEVISCAPIAALRTALQVLPGSSVYPDVSAKDKKAKELIGLD